MHKVGRNLAEEIKDSPTKAPESDITEAMAEANSASGRTERIFFPVLRYMKKRELENVVLLSELFEQIPTERGSVILWNYAVGEPLAKVTKPVFLSRKGKLRVAVADAGYSQGINQKKYNLISTLSVLLRNDFIKEIEFYIEPAHFSKSLKK